MTSDQPQSSLPQNGSRRRGSLLILAAMILAVALATGRREPADAGWTVHELGGETMGTTWSLKFVAPFLSPDLLRTIQDSVANRLDGVDGAMSTYDPDSELSHFNRHVSTEPFPVSPGVLEVFLLAQRVNLESGGAFDVTVGPLVHAWGFGPDGGPAAVPDDGLIEELQRHVGFEKIFIDFASSSLVKWDPQVVADLSAIAKGYAVDDLADLLVDLGFGDFLVEVGGELRAAGSKPEGAPWVVGVEAPVTEARSLYATMELADESIATSGDYRNFWEADGRRYSHIIDPRTGRPLPYVGAAVTVIHERAVLADAWATAMTVLGPQEGGAVADGLDLQVIFVLQGESDLIETRSRALRDRPAELLPSGAGRRDP